MKKLLILVLVVPIFIFYSCKDRIVVPAETTSVCSDKELIQKLVNMGFPEKLIVIKGDHIIVDKDIYLERKNVEKLPKIQQWRYDIILNSNKAANIRVKIDNSISSWSSKIQNALNMWNNEVSQIQFNIVSSSPDITIYSDQASGLPTGYYNLDYTVGGIASWPINSNTPGNIISINMDCPFMDTDAKRISCIAHEFGHTISFRHTNWRTQGESSAILIPETPDDDAYSLMNGGMLGEILVFSSYDKVALHTLYPDLNLFGFSGDKADRIYWNNNFYNGSLRIQNFYFYFGINIECWKCNINHAILFCRC